VDVTSAFGNGCASNKAQTILNGLNEFGDFDQEKIGRNVSLKGLPTKEDLHVHGVTELGRRHTDSVSHKFAVSADRSAKPAIHLAPGGTTEW
jgi:hypothetical protein